MTLCKKEELLGSVSSCFLKESQVLEGFFNLFGTCDRHTLWKRVQTVVFPLLAQLVSVVDHDQNLDILLDEDCNEPLKRLWLDIFSDDKLLEIPHLTPDHRSVHVIS